MTDDILRDASLFLGRSAGSGLGSFATAALALGPVAYWRVDEPSGTTAIDIIAGRNGTYINNPTLNQPGWTSDSDAAIVTDSTPKYFTVPDNAAFDLGDGPFSLCVALKRAALGVSGYVLNKGTGAYGFFFAGADNKMHFEKVNTTPCCQESGTTDTNFHFWTFTKAAASAVLMYKDGVDVTTPQNNPTLVDTASALEVGRESGSTGFAGTIDEVLIYNKVLSPAQVAALFAAR